MADELPSLHIDTDWKKQAQEEKRRLAEEEAKRTAEREQRAATATAPPGIGGAPVGPTATAASPGAAASGSARGRAGAPGAGRERGTPEASFSSLVNSLATQALLYLGLLAPRGVEPDVNLDLAKFNIDLLAVLEEKTKANLTREEQKLLDNVLYEVRTRYVAVASQYATV